MSDFDEDDDQRGIVNGDHVARLVREAGIPCTVAHTSGGTATLWVGKNLGTDDEPAYEVTMGPGNWSPHGSTFVVDDIMVGPPDDGTNPWIVGAWNERDVADLVVLCYRSPGHVPGFDALEARGFDGKCHGTERRHGLWTAV